MSQHHPSQLRPTGPDRLADLLSWIEDNLDQPLTLDSIAGRMALSPYHFSRLFAARMGRGVMAHVRGRRLVRAAQRLASDPDVRLIDLAFDCGFDSQEAFTRAFGRLFGVAPGRFRKGFAATPLEGQYPMSMPETVDVGVVQLPGLVSLDAFTVAGPSRRFDGATKAAIPQLWSVLIGALPFAGQEPGWATYGVVWAADRAEGSFDYMAGVRVAPDATPPAGFTTLRIPAATYAVFRITLNGGPLHPQVKAAMARIWGELIPASGLAVADSPDFELYDGEFAPTRPGATIDFHVPVTP
ncbi:AraC family transcriptional regulator [Nitrospirillum sp. BR 11163]|uniref:AraC family transcriptional regulator n=1 Tax=Nitrospirillum sp. BR 11163 TaxID=3104323 RepID=UPI002AFFE8BB|nr:AraC family transcriptional regulator [Nitrospirillum sp. BR 11163]MEA1676163.1 AraC family transcriptional regulator [Nitrospirillum sp. BR 11163]